MLPTLLFGFLGNAFVVDQARALGLLDAGDDANAELDEAILGFLARDAPGMGPELKDGLVGVGVYGLSRLTTPSGRTIVEQVVAQLGRRVEPQALGLRWSYDPPDAPPGHDGRASIWATGMTGGAAGHIGLLSRVCAAGVAVEQARPLLEEAVRYLLAQRRDGHAVCGYPTFTRPSGVLSAEGRLSWCNGDLAIALSLLHAARTLGVPAWEDEALRVARRSAARAAAETEVTTSGICHGAAGVGHCFHRLYRATSDPALGDAARSWLARVLDEQRPDQPPRGAPDPGILDGAAGVGLALTASLLDEEPTWDRLFLMDLPGWER